MRCAALIAAVLTLATADLRAELVLGPLFTDHMVVQRDRPIRLWGKCAPNRKISVEFAGDRTCATTAPDGRWLATLPPKAASSEPRILRISTPDETRELRDVLVGEVWLCAGQSNMEWPLSKDAHGASAIQSADLPQLRIFNPDIAGKFNFARPFSKAVMERLVAGSFFRGGWVCCTPDTARTLSAIGFYFGRDLAVELDVPIGIVSIAVGGSPAEAWIERRALLENSDLRALADGDWLANPQLDEWCRQRGRENLSSGVVTTQVDARSNPHPFKPGFLWDCLIEPMLPFSLRGVLWYQGESNALSAWRTRQHELLFPVLVRTWRRRWDQNDLPFLTCQLSGISSKNYHSESWPEFRDSQRRLALALPFVEMAVTSDLGHPSDVHPRDKRTVAERLLRIALSRVYGRTLEYSGPVPIAAKAHAETVSVAFSHAKSGLRSSDGKPLRGFEIAEAEGEFHPAMARLAETGIELQAPSVRRPVRVRYAWQPLPDATLVNGEGLPASTFALVCENE